MLDVVINPFAAVGRVTSPAVSAAVKLWKPKLHKCVEPEQSDLGSNSSKPTSHRNVNFCFIGLTGFLE